MKYLNKFLFLLIGIFLFVNLLKPCTVLAKNSNSVIEEDTLTTFLDSTTKENFEKYKLPSLSVVVVKDGKVIYENSLGYSDVENKVKADVNSTVYRIGSTSKLFTETAIMQLYEQGKIDLKEDANKYLKDIKIHNNFEKKVTIENLLTHTSGIDEATSPYGLAKTEKDMISISEFLRKHPPVVVTEPGKVCLYSNIGLDLLGNIIENVSGMKYEDYIQKNIFDVLGMKNSRVALPLKNMAKGYSDGMANKYYYYNDVPSGFINSTPLDIAKFMMAHLGNGKYGDQSILTETTAKLMHEKHFSNDKNLSGVTYGFWEKNFNGKRFIGHEGALSEGFFGDMLLCKEDNIGIYMISNSLAEAAQAITNIENDFFNKYYNINTINANNNNTINYDAVKKYIGTYRSYHDSAKNNFNKFTSFLGGALGENEDVKIDYDKEKNTLIYHGISHLKQKEDVNLVMVSNNLFRRADNNDLVAFKEDGGKIKYVFFNNAPYDSFEKVDFKDNYKINLIIFISALLLFMFQVLKSIFLFIRNLCKRRPISNNGKLQPFEIKLTKVFKILILFISMINIVAFVGIIYWIITLFDMCYGVLWYMKISSILLIISTILSIISAIIFILSVKREKTKNYYKITGLFSLCIIYMFILFLYNFNLLGFNY